MTEVADRTRATLEAAVVRYILPGTLIMSDGWVSYHALDQIQGGIYSHEVIIHDQHFVDPQNQEIHTQGIESA